MYGVVLWSDPDARKAVIWCEDHGDLAFYSGGSDLPLGEVSLDAGDLVEFDVTTERALRYAHNPQVVSEGFDRDIAQRLDGAAEPTVAAARPARKAGERRILPFRRPGIAAHPRNLQPSLSLGF
jgi:hypothetical protein